MIENDSGGMVEEVCFYGLRLFADFAMNKNLTKDF